MGGELQLDRKTVDRLKHAIVKQACRDYCSATQKLRRKPRDETARRTIRECERFFRGGWFMTLYDLDGDWILQKLREKSERNERIRFGTKEEDDL